MYKMDRNAACWCGSGKKYKTCHEEFDEKYEALAGKRALKCRSVS